jgi:hypothetical protein
MKKFSSRISKVPKVPFKKSGSGAGKTGQSEPIPRITNESIAAHREEVLSSARKYIYPLRHSRHRVVKTSIIIFVASIIVFFIGCVVSLYKFQNTSTFMYGVTRVIPFPVAKAGNSPVSYDSYLFELRHYMHYYESQQGVNFNTEDGQRQLANFKKQAMDQVVNQAYVKQVAKSKHISVSGAEVNRQVALVRAQNRLGSSDEVFRSVLQEFWGWSVADFKSELKNEVLEQKVIAKLDTKTNQRAQNALTQLNGGADFAALATKLSDDTATKANGGEYSVPVDRSSRDISPQAVEALFALSAGQHTEVINSGYYLEIDKAIEVNGDKIRAAHMTFNFADIDTYLKDQKQAHPTMHFLRV